MSTTDVRVELIDALNDLRDAVSNHAHHLIIEGKWDEVMSCAHIGMLTNDMLAMVDR